MVITLEFLIKVICLSKRIKKYIAIFILIIFYSSPTLAPAESKAISLSDGLSIVTDNNRLIRIASRNESISYADTVIARSRLLPSINAYANQNFLAHQPGAVLGPMSVYTGEKSSLSYGINLYQTIYDFGANTSLYEASQKSLEVTKHDILRIKNLVAMDFINAYLNLLENDKMLLVAQREAERLESHVRDSRNLYNEGVITKNDLLQAEVRLSDARQRLLTSKNLRAFNSSRINNLLSMPLSQEIQVQDVAMETPANIEIETAWEIAEKTRLEIKMADQDIKIIELQEEAKKSEYYPRLFTQGGYSYTENQYQIHEDNWSIILGVNINLLSGGSTKAEISKLNYRKAQLIEQRDKIIEDIKLEVKRYYLNVKNAVEKIQVSRDAVNQAEENLRINILRFEAGVGTSTDVLDAIALLTVAETNDYRSIYELMAAQAGLSYAMGLDLVSLYKR